MPRRTKRKIITPPGHSFAPKEKPHEVTAEMRIKAILDFADILLDAERTGTLVDRSAVIACLPFSLPGWDNDKIAERCRWLARHHGHAERRPWLLAMASAIEQTPPPTAYADANEKGPS